MCGRGACALGGARYRSAVERRLHRGAKTGCLHEAARPDAAATTSKPKSVNVAFPGETLFAANFNVGPGQQFPVLRADNGETLELVDSRWGLHAPFGKQGQYVINARSETVTEKPLFKKHLQNRCVLFLSGFYEWHQDIEGKRPYFIRMKDSESPEDLMAIACLMDTDTKSDKAKSAFAVLTADASPEFAWCHDRQPVILPSASAILQWLLEPSFAACSDLLGSRNVLQWHKVHPMVGSIRNNGPKCIEVYADAKQSEAKQSSLASWVSRKARTATESGLPEGSESLSTDGLLSLPVKRPRSGPGSEAAEAAVEEWAQCPICGQRVAATEIEQHANRCADASGFGKSTATSAQLELGCGEQEVACPICGKVFPVSLAQRHANECADAAAA